MTQVSIRAAAVLGAVSLSVPAMAIINPFTETFSSAASNWSTNSVALTPLNYPSSGGPDGSAYGSMSLDLTNQGVNAQPITFAGQGSFNSSGNAFVGNWLSAGVTSVSLSVRHNGPGALTFFLRFAPAGGPGAVAVLSPAVPANTWTTLSIPLVESYPGFIWEGPSSTFTPTFTSMSKLQVGLLVDASIANRATPLTVDIDNVSIVPAPGTAGLLAGAMGLMGLRRRRS